ncbi:golgin subfamily A member 2 [Leptopilina boulardi]|uniref:golgin subfamily A member 2 n=1 Tax=Leptopilina boulardi TaxID=63433 RepID=UPI0021F6224E|nr:golgin subfamily A member 2 [Leptopilina boulardi]
MDKEKLCAARKKLKQYQLFKKDNSHRHQGSEYPNNEYAKNNNEATKEHFTKCDNINFETENCENNSLSSEKLVENINSPEFTSVNVNYVKDEKYPPQIIESNSNFTSANDFIYHTNNTVDNFQSVQSVVSEESVLRPQNNDSCNITKISESNDSSAIISSNTSLKDINNEDRNTMDNLYDSSLLQKENLLQMASSVAQVLTDVNEFNEATTMNNLIDKNKFLTNCLQEQANLISELHDQVSRYSCRISEMEAIIAANNAESTNKIIQEINPLKQQIQLHTHTTGILVAEKAELKATVDQCYAIIKQKTELIEDLNKQLKSRQFEMIEHEKESTLYKKNHEEINGTYQLLQQNYEKLMDDCSSLRKDKEGLELECSELKQKLNLSNTNLSSVQQELQEKNGLLSLNEIKIRQLISTSDQLQSLENDRQAVIVYEQQLAQLKDNLSALSHEKDEANIQYKSYLEQSDERLRCVKTELNQCHNRIEELEAREKDYVQKLLQMEQQLQHEREQVESFKPLLEHKVEMLTKNIDNLVLEQESLQLALNQKDAEIEALNKELQELPDIKNDSIDASALATALQSEQLGASRAIYQNQQLKHQLDEMHDAFVLLSNNKLDLTEQLQSERNSCKQLNIELTAYKSTLEDLENQLKEKDAALINLKSEKLQNTDLPFKMTKYESSESNDLLQELNSAKNLIENLQRENILLKEELSLQIKQSAIQNKENTESNNTNNQTTISNQNELDQSLKVETDIYDNKNFIIPEFIKKLEDRFKETMDRVAELTDEKQKLEHLVLQLQEETETIGEYVALYQKQRSILQGRAKEREQTFKQISEQRDYQQEQINKLKFLVAKLLKSKPTAIKDAFQEIENPQSSCDTKEHLEELKFNSNLAESFPSDSIEVKTNVNDEDESTVVGLLSEIKDCRGTCTQEPNIHPCPLCSGKLITI